MSLNRRHPICLVKKINMITGVRGKIKVRKGSEGGRGKGGKINKDQEDFDGEGEE